MNKTISITLLAATAATGSHAAAVIGFDDAALAPESFANGSDGSGGFTFGGVHLNNVYDSNHDFWGGFALSNITDNQNPGWTNQYSAIPGGDHSGSGTDAVA